MASAKPTSTRPRLALVAWSIGVRETLAAGLVRRAVADYDLVVIAQDLVEELRPLVDWRRVRAPREPRLRGPAFMLGATLRSTGLEPDLIHVVSPLPALARRADLVSPNFTLSSMYEASVGRPGDALPMLWRAARRLGRAWERWAYSPARVRTLAALSEGQRGDLERLFPGVPVVLTPAGVDTKRFRPDPDSRAEVRRELGLGEDEVVACFAARPERRKGLDLVLGALARIRRCGGTAVRLLVAGREPSWMQAVAGRLEVEDAILPLGPRDDIERIYRAADLHVIASQHETHCQVAHEAAASGLPLISTSVHGARELVSGGGGLLTERSSEAIAEAITRLADDPALRRRLGEAGRQLTLERRSDSFAESTVDLYGRLLAEAAR